MQRWARVGLRVFPGSSIGLVSSDVVHVMKRMKCQGGTSVSLCFALYGPEAQPCSKRFSKHARWQHRWLLRCVLGYQPPLRPGRAV